MANIKIEFSYNGQNYYGLQKQADKKTVQGEIEKALFKLLKTKTSIILAGRTDKGVCAQKMVANFETNYSINPQKICYALNALLPSDIRILTSQKVCENFHARHSAKSKTYCYKLYYSTFELPLFPFESQIKFDINFKNMKKAMKYLVGTKDFSSFVTNSKQYANCIRTIFRAEIKKENILGIDHYYFYFKGNGFLYNQIRNMVGTILLVGQNKIKPKDIKKILNAKDRRLAGSCMPANGLTLMSIEY